MSNYIVYLLVNTCNSNTYVGITNNKDRRLRQHNGEIVGGAKATREKGIWNFYAVLTGFSDHKEALCCEWRIKHPTNSRKRLPKYCGIKGRIDSLNVVLNLDNWTKPCKERNIGLCTGTTYTLYLAEDVFNIVNKDNIKDNIIIRNLDELEI